MPELPDEAEVQRRLGILQASFESGESQLIGKGGGDPVEVVDPSPDWPLMFAEIRTRLLEALGPTALRVEHVGSTSIPGIAAKPVIDVEISVPDIEDETAFVSQIEALGWALRSREPGHRYFRDPAGTPRRVQVHVCQVGSKWEREHLLFRDYLRTHPERARAYETLKRAAGARYPTNRLAYTEAKGPFIEETLTLAEAWAAETGWRP